MLTQARSRNRILSSLDDRDASLLLSSADIIDCNLGEILVRSSAQVQHAYFPLSGLVSVVASTDDGGKFEIGMYGKEGMGPATVVLGSNQTTNEHIVQAQGQAIRVPAALLKSAMDSSATLSASLLQYVDVFLVQVSHTALANGKKSASVRLARWLLMFHDRIEGSIIYFPPKLLNLMISASPDVIASALTALEQSAALRVEGESIHILDREILRAISGENYGVPEAEQARLFLNHEAGRRPRVAKS